MLAQSVGSGPFGLPNTVREFSPRAKKSARPRVLVVDDEPLVRWAIAEIFQDCGYDISEADDGATAIRTLAAGSDPTDLVLLDLHLPDCNDLRLLTAIRRIVPEIPVILMTAFATGQVRQEASRIGAFSVLDKPFDLDGLARLVARALVAGPPS